MCRTYGAQIFFATLPSPYGLGYVVSRLRRFGFLVVDWNVPTVIRHLAGVLCSGVPKGRHNVAHSGSCGKNYKKSAETPSGVTHGIRPCHLSLSSSRY
jgi:hypothetical protein